MTVKELLEIIGKGDYFNSAKKHLLNLTITKALFLVSTIVVLVGGGAYVLKNRSHLFSKLESITNPAVEAGKKQAITFVQNYQGDGQSQTVLKNITAILQDSQGAGEIIVVQGWAAEHYVKNIFYVNFYYENGGSPRSISFIVDLDAKNVRSRDGYAQMLCGC